MSADFLLELLSEEIPARMQEKASADLARLFEAEIAKAGLKADLVETYATPRRLALIARGLPAGTQAVSEETKGPKTSAPPQALEGFLRKTGLKREQLTERDGILYAIVEKPGRATTEVLAEAIPSIVRAFPWPKSMRWGPASASTASLRWVRPLQGILALFGEDVVPMEIDGIVSGAATLGHRFHHPGMITIGSANDYAEKLRACHVILDPAERRGIIEGGARAIAEARGLHVIPDPGLVAENAGLTEWPVPLLGDFDPAFLEVPREVIQLTMRTNQKYFACVDGAGKLAPNFICTANIAAADGGLGIVAGNRKVLAARLSDAKFFWEQDLKVPLAEHAKKLDQIVFHEKLGTVADKVDRVAKLARWLVESDVVTPAKAGVSLGGGTIPPHEMPASAGMTMKGKLADMAEQAARLAKADLVTGMVGEFPELQGVMGGYYARAEGLPHEVADAIRDHYKPVGQGDDVPTAPVTVAVSLADKLDTIFSFALIDERPTGSKDPFALRRAALGVLAMLENSGLRLRIFNAFSIAAEAIFTTKYARASEPYYGVASSLPASWNVKLNADQIGMSELSPEELWDFLAAIPGTDFIARFPEGFAIPGRVMVDGDGTSVTVKPRTEIESIAQDRILNPIAAYEFCAGFFADRLKVQQREAGVRHDLIDAVFALGGEDDLVRLLARVKALQAFVSTEEGTNLLAGYKRAANILRKEGWDEATGQVDSPLRGNDGAGGASALSYQAEPPEAALIAALDTAESSADAAVKDENFEAAMGALATLRGPIDAFFDSVTVNDVDPAKRAARLALLARIRTAVHRVADFSKIEG